MHHFGGTMLPDPDPIYVRPLDYRDRPDANPFPGQTKRGPTTADCRTNGDPIEYLRVRSISKSRSAIVAGKERRLSNGGCVERNTTALGLQKPEHLEESLLATRGSGDPVVRRRAKDTLGETLCRVMTASQQRE